jgi:hypothetical protein
MRYDVSFRQKGGKGRSQTNEAPIKNRAQTVEKSQFAEEKNLDFASPGFGFPSLGFAFHFPRL